MARLDRLSDVKDVAHLAATLGRVFHHDLLVAVSTSDETTLAHASRAAGRCRADLSPRAAD